MLKRLIHRLIEKFAPLDPEPEFSAREIDALERLHGPERVAAMLQSVATGSATGSVRVGNRVLIHMGHR